MAKRNKNKKKKKKDIDVNKVIGLATAIITLTNSIVLLLITLKK